MPSVTMYGGFYQLTQKIIDNGLYSGVSLLYLCNQVGGIRPTSTIQITGQNGHIFKFTYDMVANGINFNPTYTTYNNLTGAQQAATQPITIILAYSVNGTNFPTKWLPAPRLVVVGSEGLLFEGEGGRSINQITLIDTAPPPTPTPTTPPPTLPSATSTLPSSKPSPILNPSSSLTPSQKPSLSAAPSDATPTPIQPSPSSSIPEFPVSNIIVLVAAITSLTSSLLFAVHRKKQLKH